MLTTFDMICDIYNHEDELTYWEANFINHLIKKYKTDKNYEPWYKQDEKIKEIWLKCC